MARKSRRKTADAAELSRVLSEASKRRTHFRGGRPRGAAHDQGVKTCAVRGLDHEVFRALAQKKRKSIIDIFHCLAAAVVSGATIAAHEDCKPDGWRYLLLDDKGGNG